MANCNCLKNPHYKSSSQFYNTTVQAIAETATPLSLLGTEVTDTGASVNVLPTAIQIDHGGLYQIEIAISVNATTAGAVSVALAKNGSVLPETRRTETLAAGNGVIETGTVRYMSACCCQEPTQIQVLVNGDGTAAGNVTLVSGCIVKLA